MQSTTTGSARMRQDRRFRCLAVTVVVALVATACAGGGNKEEAAPADPGVTTQGTGEFQLLLSTGQVEATEEIGRATSELPSLMRISYAVFCLKKNTYKE